MPPANCRPNSWMTGTINNQQPLENAHLGVSLSGVKSVKPPLGSDQVLAVPFRTAPSRWSCIRYFWSWSPPHVWCCLLFSHSHSHSAPLPPRKGNKLKPTSNSQPRDRYTRDDPLAPASPLHYLPWLVFISQSTIRGTGSIKVFALTLVCLCPRGKCFSFPVDCWSTV